MEFIDNENLKTKVYKSKRNKKPYVKELSEAALQVTSFERRDG